MGNRFKKQLATSDLDAAFVRSAHLKIKIPSESAAGSRGDHCTNGPPYEFIFVNCNRASEDLEEVAAAVTETAEESVKANSGSIRCS